MLYASGVLTHTCVWLALFLCRKEGPCPRGTFSNKEGNRLCTPW